MINNTQLLYALPSEQLSHFNLIFRDIPWRSWGGTTPPSDPHCPQLIRGLGGVGSLLIKLIGTDSDDYRERNVLE
jgi:hypothetical protein